MVAPSIGYTAAKGLANGTGSCGKANGVVGHVVPGEITSTSLDLIGKGERPY